MAVLFECWEAAGQHDYLGVREAERTAYRQREADDDASLLAQADWYRDTGQSRLRTSQ